MTEEIDQIYDRAGMTENRVGFGENPAVVNVDIQYGMTDPENPLGADLSEMVSTANEVVESAHGADVPVIYTRAITTHPDNADMGAFVKKVPTLQTLEPRSRWVEIDDRMTVSEDDHVLEKRQQSAFHGTELHAMLTGLGVDTVIVTGCSTSGCVRATVVDACSDGFRTIVPEEAVGDRSRRQHEANLFDMNAKNADVVSVDEVIGYLEEQA